MQNFVKNFYSSTVLNPGTLDKDFSETEENEWRIPSLVSIWTAKVPLEVLWKSVSLPPFSTPLY